MALELQHAQKILQKKKTNKKIYVNFETLTYVVLNVRTETSSPGRLKSYNVILLLQLL